MFHTDRNIVYIPFKIKENEEDEGDAYDGGDRAAHDVGQESNLREVPRLWLRGGCSQDEFQAFTQQWSLSTGCHSGMDERELRTKLLNSIDRPLEDALYDALRQQDLHHLGDRHVGRVGETRRGGDHHKVCELLQQGLRGEPSQAATSAQKSSSQ
jgi:hypothetical protein